MTRSGKGKIPTNRKRQVNDNKYNEEDTDTDMYKTASRDTT